MLPLIPTVAKTIARHDMLRMGDRVLVAVSGGADSAALLRALWELRREYRLSLVAAHLDHGLRPEGPKEAAFVGEMAAGLGVPFVHRKADVRAFQEEKGLSLQEAAREVRYAFLQEAARETGAAKIALGHTADDQAESVILRLLRGAGTRGLSGIPPVRDGILIRPLIGAWREEIEAFLRERKAAFLSDPSNRSPHYLRNRVRHELLPLLAQYNPRIRQNLVQTADLFRAEEEFWHKHLEETFPPTVRGRGKEGWTLDVPSLLSLSLPIRLRCLRRGIEMLQGNLRGIHLSHILAINSLLEGTEPNKTLKLPRGVSATRAYHALNLCPWEEAPAAFELPVPGPGTVEIPEAGLAMRFDLQAPERKGFPEDSPNVALLDFDDLEFPLTLRSFRPGDRFQPLGMEGEKKVKDLFIDCKIPARQRKRIPLLCRGGRILWVAGVRMDHRARLKPRTRTVLRAELH